MLPVDTRSRGQTDADIRALLIPRLLQDAVRSNSLLIEELGLMSGEFRADIAVLGTKLIGYEIKSETDTLSRLPRQAAAYGAIFDEVWLVASSKHIAAALLKIPEFWGVLEAPPGASALVEVRAAGAHVSHDAISIAALLWRDETLGELQRRGAERGVKSKPRRELWARLTEVTTLPELRQIIVERMRARTLKSRVGIWLAHVSPQFHAEGQEASPLSTPLPCANN